MTFLPFLKELLGGVDVGKDGDKGDDETQDPDADYERDDNTCGEIFSVGFWESYNLTPSEKK